MVAIPSHKLATRIDSAPTTTSTGVATTTNFLIYPTGKSGSSNAIRLCISAGGRILQKAAGAACPS